jgi:hypothetical protein
MESFGIAYDLIMKLGWHWAYNDTLTYDLFLRSLTAFSTLIIGLAASVLAYQQFRISKAKLRFDLYQKRYDLFLKLRMFVSDLATGPGNDHDVILTKAGVFKRDTIDCRFLFDADVVAYFDEVYSKACELSRAKLAFLRPALPDEEADRLREAMTTLHVWFFNQSEAMFNLFKKDLSIKTLR